MIKAIDSLPTKPIRNKKRIEIRLAGLVSFFALLLMFALLPVASLALADDEILTPQPPDTPRINGAKVFGVRPGHPVLYTIAATGDRPMQFSAEGLPEGVKLDANTGFLSGKSDKPGEYKITLHAKNAKGKTDSKFKLVVGDTIALTPQLGWNSWNCFGPSVTGQEYYGRRRCDGEKRSDQPRLDVRQYRRLLGIQPTVGQPEAIQRWRVLSPRRRRHDQHQ